MLNYLLTPEMDLYGWDYESHLDDPNLHDIASFDVNGVILGPACPSALPPGTEPYFFPGTNKHAKESNEINQLLSYEAPLVDKFHVDKNVKETEMIIHYDENIDPKSFKVKPKKLRKYFNPVPGTTQCLNLPLKKFTKKHKKNHHRKMVNVHIAKIKLEVKATNMKTAKSDKKHKSENKKQANDREDHKEKKNRAKHENKDKHVNQSKKQRKKDKDVFIIRIDD